MPAKKLFTTILLLAAILCSSCAVFIYDTEEDRHDHDKDDDSITIIIH